MVLKKRSNFLHLLPSKFNNYAYELMKINIFSSKKVYSVNSLFIISISDSRCGEDIDSLCSTGVYGPHFEVF